mmetsp:Transcript_23176/g.77799  ORF Transcript_23176/g.77799 Transcript_23176/m.77799 type:complete len:113 (+) Transcript_23176:282-620(+)
MTQEIKDDLQALKMRDVADRKRFFKSSDYKKNELPTAFQLGTVIAGATDFQSERIARRDRKQSLLQELMGDSSVRKYAKKKHLEVQEATQRGGKRDVRAKKRANRPGWTKRK